MNDNITIDNVIKKFDDGCSIVEFEYSYGIPLQAECYSDKISLKKELNCEIDFICLSVENIYINEDDYYKNRTSSFGAESIYYFDTSYIIRCKLGKIVAEDDKYIQFESKLDSFNPIIVIPKKITTKIKTDNVVHISAFAVLQILN